MIGRADIEGSKSDVAMNAWPPQASSVIPRGRARLARRRSHCFSVALPVGSATLSASVEPASIPPRARRPAGGAADSAADCLYPMDYYRTLVIGTPGCCRRALGTMGLTRVPRIQACRPPAVSHSRQKRRPGTDMSAAHDVASSGPEGYPCGNFSGTSSLKCRGTKGSIGHTFMVCIHTENQNQGDFYPFVLLEISVLHEPPLGHLRYGLTDVPPQPNSPPDNVFNPGRPAEDLNTRTLSFRDFPQFDGVAERVAPLAVAFYAALTTLLNWLLTARRTAEACKGHRHPDAGSRRPVARLVAACSRGVRPKPNNYSLPRIFKGRRERTGPSRGAGLFQPLNPSSGQTDFRLRCRAKPTSRCRNIDRLPFRQAARILIEVFATTTKICTRGRSTRARALGFVTDPHVRLLLGASFLPRGRADSDFHGHRPAVKMY
ncbi:hypothetical protein Trco_006556 [Trichoderma cornu-damae]|uniref:Uncharacterized protein n=1 Tax=Trichoderma cornu-damae TaxID=654480 RepID=A0A9P8TTU9_9HYPO|nr:hypothetical protein Trco_006556 [Trichoderma cornu-damae]